MTSKLRPKVRVESLRMKDWDCGGWVENRRKEVCCRQRTRCASIEGRRFGAAMNFGVAGLEGATEGMTGGR